jgi:hypothetical protein
MPPNARPDHTSRSPGLPGKPYPNTTEAGVMKVNDNAGSQRVDAARAVSVHPPSLSRKMGKPPVLTSPNPISTLPKRFACARLSQSYLPQSCSGFSATFTTSLLTTAACGGLRSTPDCRLRRTYLHLSYSYASPCGPPAVLILAWRVSRSASSMAGRVVCRYWSPLRSSLLLANTDSGTADSAIDRPPGYPPRAVRP